MEKRVKKTKGRLITQVNPNSQFSEQYKIIQTSIDFSVVDKPYQTILVTSAEPGTGKSTTAANLAVVYAQKGKKVLLVDGDMRKPTIHKIFRESNIVGMSNNLTENLKLSESLLKSETKGLFILTSGVIPPNPGELLNSKRMKQLLSTAKKNFDFIIIDSPPMLMMSDSIVLASLADGVVIVVRKQLTKKEALNRTIQQLNLIQAQIIGVVFNGESANESEAYYYEYK